MLAAHGLLRAGYEVTLYSDKTPEDFLERARPTGTAARFHSALEFERELGLDHWENIAPKGDGIHLHFNPTLRNTLVTLVGRLDHHYLAIDLRLQSARWLEDLEARGGKVELETVTVERLDELAAQYDLVLVAAGKGETQRLFPRDEARSTYATPQRYLAMVNVTGPAMEFPYLPGRTPVKFNFFAPHGEMFWVPWLSKDLEPSWSLVFEAKEGGPVDRFREVSSADEALRVAQQVMAEMAPWDAEWVRDARPCDENSWLRGTFVPEVRDVVGTLPSGRTVMAVGDTAHTLDPIGGQGANNGNKMARTVVDAIVERGGGPFGSDWMRDTFDRFWQRHGRHTERFNAALLEPLTAAGKAVLIAQYGSGGSPEEWTPQDEVARAFCNNFDDPARLTDAFYDPERAKAAVREAHGSTLWPLLRGRAGIARGQIRQRLGREAGHPGT
ncbi:oxidoreductase [Egibacter rhizosphaerae]|uniref:Oxidoreductase n=1 Tax=Egibacter rhizosphaerae TaxID=1670831 RepID=A0A411YLE9_9ACTN|nr:oxidoreductase [Egibacter rhizosphaerae]